MSALQSWSPEVQHLVQSDAALVAGPECDRVVTTPTYIMKIDACEIHSRMVCRHRLKQLFSPVCDKPSWLLNLS